VVVCGVVELLSFCCLGRVLVFFEFLNFSLSLLLFGKVRSREGGGKWGVAEWRWEVMGYDTC